MSEKSAEPVMIYEQNGGSALAIAGSHFVVIAADSRLSSKSTIHTRRQDKIYEMSPRSVICSTGSLCDALGLMSIIQRRIEEYTLTHHKIMSLSSQAQLISTIMYGKRFMPYHLTNIVAGLDTEGVGAVYMYDPVGHFQRTKYGTIGTAHAILQPILDNVIESAQEHLQIENKESLPLKLVEEIATEAFISATERDIYTGDYLFVKTIIPNGTSIKEIPLCKD